MKLVVDFLKKSQTQYLATIGTDGKPKVRPFQFKLEEGGKLYFSTTNDKQVYKEITQHPYVELCACGENWSWLRLSGKVVFSAGSLHQEQDHRGGHSSHQSGLQDA